MYVLSTILIVHVLGYFPILYLALTNLKIKTFVDKFIIGTFLFATYPFLVLVCGFDKLVYDRVYGSPFHSLKGPKILPKVRLNPKARARA